MGMTQWAWTPKRWFESIESMGEAKGAKSEDLQREEGQKLTEVVFSKKKKVLVGSFSWFCCCCLCCAVFGFEFSFGVVW